MFQSPAIHKRLLLGTLIGALAWSGPPSLIALSLLFPVVCRWPHPALRRRDQALIAACYYAAATWPVIPSGIRLYHAGAASFLLVLWITASLLLALPWCLPAPPAIAMALTVVPPLGIIGVANPLTTAGVLFPGTAWLGLAFTAVLPSLVIAWPKPTLAFAALAFFTTNVMYRDPAPPQYWVALDTQFGDVRSPNDFAAEFRASEFIQSAAMNTDFRVLVFPEMVVTRWTEATEAFWEPTLRKLAEQQRTLIVGAGLPIGNSRDYRNALVVAGAERQHFFQRIPLPGVMWNPIATRDRVPLRLRGPAILTVAGERAAPLICYEQLIPWPILTAAMDHPSAILAVSNATWTHHTPIPSVQKSSIAAWSHLFRIPILSATNGPIPPPADLRKTYAPSHTTRPTTTPSAAPGRA